MLTVSERRIMVKEMLPRKEIRNFSLYQITKIHQMSNRSFLGKVRKILCCLNPVNPQKTEVLAIQKSYVSRLPNNSQLKLMQQKIRDPDTMEDAWVVLPDASLEYPGKLRCAHFAIYDGHGGRLAAEYAQAHLHANVLSAGLPRELMDVKAAKKAVLEGFKRTDETLLQESAKGNWQDGATSVVYGSWDKRL
ncbi:uncharacterized protein M6B38_155595 [Iris pallida]|uniref:protein-serine/threonine phosphatase n=1 Tax=Iris pallida TaxID=29817 RepID=A0AAX6F5Q2_IRIPA|nr:uncharacterized protein M6B38_155595 [Iris pallida]